jgi:hypothetical protein
MSEIQMQNSKNVVSYNPSLCKTCQKLAVVSPQPARARFSDCEEHFRKRVTTLLLNGGLYMV